ncbi:MAG TPA: acyltransferase family protein [Gammaproteobacteria bacterium]|nr:acyltransferase family protein [Gammaproteobacteria bacterium]
MRELNESVDSPRGPSNYRADIDGMRAIAVLSVMLYHVSTAWVPGGFVGVDIFFVISGYLITRNIAVDLGRGRFSLIDFYARRVRRIAPMMLTIVLVVLVLAMVLFIPVDARATAKSAAWSVASLANVYFWLFQDNSYFAAPSAESPLLHLWSLGVEEQFYLFWPLLLLLFYRARRAGLFCAIAAVVAFASFALGNLVYPRDPAFAYYMLPTRAGELLLGALVAVATLHGMHERISAKASGRLAAAGFALIIASLALVSGDRPYPGLIAIAPTGGAALLILAGTVRTTRVSRFLALRPLVRVGLISYSAYLWHWPLLAFYRYGYGQPKPATGLAIIAIALALSELTYRLIEQPARHFRGPLWKVFAGQYVLPATVVAAVVATIIFPANFQLPWLSATYRARLAAARATAPAFASPNVCQVAQVQSGDLSDPDCVLGAAGNSAPVILWGDSNAAHYVGMVDEIALKAGFRFRNIEVTACPPVEGDPAPFVAPTRAGKCRASLAVIRPEIGHYKAVILSAAYTTYANESPDFLSRFLDTARHIAGEGKVVVIIGKAPAMDGYDRRCWQKALSYPFLTCPEIVRPIEPAVARVNDRLRHFATQMPNIFYFDVTPLLCSDGRCSERDDEGRDLYYDEDHLSIAASHELGKEVLQATGVPDAFAAIGTSLDADDKPNRRAITTRSH